MNAEQLGGDAPVRPEDLPEDATQEEVLASNRHWEDPGYGVELAPFRELDIHGLSGNNEMTPWDMGQS